MPACDVPCTGHLTPVIHDLLYFTPIIPPSHFVLCIAVCYLTPVLHSKAVLHPPNTPPLNSLLDWVFIATEPSLLLHAGLVLTCLPSLWAQLTLRAVTPFSLASLAAQLFLLAIDWYAIALRRTQYALRALHALRVTCGTCVTRVSPFPRPHNHN